jgi:hypothetical protein
MGSVAITPSGEPRQESDRGSAVQQKQWLECGMLERSSGLIQFQFLLPERLRDFELAIRWLAHSRKRAH